MSLSFEFVNKDGSSESVGVATLRTALEIADEAARSDIESFCDIPSGELRGWYSTAPRQGRDTYEVACIKRALLYLSTRGRLLRHPTDSSLVKVTT